MEFRLLGPLEVRIGGDVVPVGGPKQRALLALLLLHANEVVSRDRLIDELWPDRPSAGHSLDHQISRLRKLLAPSDLLATRPGGYVLELEPDQIDARVFEHAVGEGRRANAAGRPSEAARVLRNGLSLWRGPALADLAYESFARAEIERLEELRLSAIEERVDADLQLGRHHALVSELESLTARHPLRERLRADLMLALYRSGRQADALRVYTDTRTKLIEELGIEPTPALQQLEQAILRQDPSLDAPAGRGGASRRSRRVVVPVLAVVFAAAAAAAGLLLAGGGTQAPAAQTLAEPDSVALLAASTGKTILRAPARAVLATQFGAGSLWSLSMTGDLSRIDPSTGEVLAFLNTGIVVPCGLAAGAASVWVSDCASPEIAQIDPALDPPAVVNRVRLPVSTPELATQTGQVALGAGSLWVAQGAANPSYVHRLDARTGQIQQSILVPEGGARALAFADRTLWVSHPSTGQVSRIDARTNKLIAGPAVGDANICCVAAGEGYAWVATNPDHQVWKLARSGRVVTTIQLDGVVDNLAFGGGAVWAAVGDAGAVVRIDPNTDVKRTYRLGHHPGGVAARDGLVAVGVRESAANAAAGLRGRIVTVAMKEDYLDWTSPDPAATQTAFNPYQVQFQYATCAKLFNYPDRAGAEGLRLAPEVAAGWPAITDGGRTYTIRIRPGFRFSPPSHEQVTAEAFRREIERVLSPKLAPGPWSLAEFPELAGAAAYNAGKTKHISGLSVRGGALVLRLVKPAPDLAARLAGPKFCAVPAETPIVLHGLSSPIPSAGPYYLAAHAGDAFVLERNPNYGGRRPQKLDAIVIRTGVDVARGISLLETGEVDYLAEVDAALAPETSAARTAGERYRLVPNNWTERLVLNTRRSLFADPRQRRAVAYALDRPRLVSGLTPLFAIPTSRVLPPNAGRRDAAGYPLAGDRRTARRLTAGRPRRVVFAAPADAGGNVFDPSLVRALREQLGEIGMRLVVVPLRQADDPTRSAVLARADLTRATANASMTSDPVDYLRSLPYLPAADRARLDRIAALPAARRNEAAARLAGRLDREAAVLGFADLATPELVSRRVGCVVDQPMFPGVDLAALCLR